jgi:hypothetical protein
VHEVRVPVAAGAARARRSGHADGGASRLVYTRRYGARAPSTAGQESRRGRTRCVGSVTCGSRSSRPTRRATLDAREAWVGERDVVFRELARTGSAGIYRWEKRGSGHVV